jgi:predicted nuclease with TOPRIM domain
VKGIKQRENYESGNDDIHAYQ